jgi:hypothetical protein
MRKVTTLLGIGAAVALTLSMGAMASASTAKARPDNTGSCGPTCVEVSFLQPGRQWVQVDYYGRTGTGTANNLQARTDTNPNEDFRPDGEGAIIPVYCASPGVAAINSILTNNQCELLFNAGLDSSTAFQLQFSPLGVESNMCSGTVGDANPVNGDRIRLEPCGATADTLWIADSPDSGPHGSVPYINGASSNYSNPLVVTAVSGAPKYQKLEVRWLITDTAGIVSDRQLVVLEPGL